jgi:hypothetical protein
VDVNLQKENEMPSICRRPRWIRVLAILAATLFATAHWTQAQNVPPSIEIETYNHRQVAAREVLVRFRADTATSLVQAEDLLPPKPLGGIRQLYRLRSRTRSVASLIQALSSRSDVVYAEPNYIVHATQIPNDPDFGLLWALHNTGQSDSVYNGTPGADISATAAWDVSTGSRVNVVTVVDTGIDYTHPDLTANLWSAPTAFSVTIAGVPITCAAGTHGFNAITNTCDPMDDNQHGTHVSGIIGASGNNAIGVVGVNWTTSIMGAKFLDSTGSGTTADAINAIEFAIQAKQALGLAANVRVLSNSWGGGGFGQALLDEINSANANNMLFVAGAGNNTSSNDIAPFYPASYTAPNVIAVAATDNRDMLASFSNYGAQSVHLGAPGVNIFSTLPGGSYGYLSGTSMATPYVAGAAMLLLSACSLDTAGVKNALIGNVDLVPSLETTTITGGRLNVSKAIHNCRDSVVVSPGSVSFGNQVIQEPSSPFTVTLSNRQSTTLAIGSINVSGDFAVTSSTCGGSLGAQSSCAIAITFTAAEVGYRAGILSIVDNSATSPHQVSLAGTGLVPVAVSPSDLVYPPQLVGTDSFAQAVTLVNNQSTALTLTGIAATGDFTQSNTCIPQGMSSGDLLPGAQCTANIIFNPTAAGNCSGQLTVTDLNWSSPQIVQLSGVGSGLISGGFVGIETPAVARVSHTATLLNNGKVLLAGGDVSTAAELYDGATGMFTPAGNLETYRGWHSGTLLPSGKVLLAGGSTGSGATSSAELYDPNANAITVTGAMTVTRYTHTATLLRNGKVLIAGGLGPAYLLLASAELYDPGSGSFTAIGSMTTVRYRHTATLLNDGTVLLAGGCYGECVDSFDAEIYDPQTGQFSGVGNMLNSRSGHTATLLSNGTVLITGGFFGSPTAELYHPSTKSFTATGEMTNGPYLWHLATLLYNGLVLLTGTHQVSNNTWSNNGAQTYDPQSGLFTAASNMGRARSGHTATALNNGQVLVTGGDEIGCTPLGNGWCRLVYGPSAELYVPQSLPVISWATPAAITYGTTLSSTQLNATASVPGTFIYNPAAGTTPAGGTNTLSVTFSPTDTTDYTTATANVSLTVNKATPIITWATPAAITYGTTLSSTQLNATASVPGTFIYNPAAGTTPAGGTNTLSVTFSPTDTTDYNTATAAVTLAVADFTFTPPSGSSTSANVVRGQAATYTLSVGGQGGLSGTVTFACTGAPSKATCTVSPNPVTAGNSATNVTVTVTTTAASVSAPRSRPLPPVPPLLPGLKGLLMLALILAAMPWAMVRRNQPGVSRWQSTMVPLAAGLLLALALAGCGGGGGGGGGVTHNPGTPAGTYTLTVTGTAGSGSSALSHSVALTLTVS